MDAAFRQNHKANEDENKDYDDADADAEVDEIDEPPSAPPAQRHYPSAHSATQPAAAVSDTLFWLMRVASILIFLPSSLLVRTHQHPANVVSARARSAKD